MSYTKGEWKAERELGTFSIYGDNKLLLFTYRHPRTTLKEAEANTHLIVTAVNACALVNPDNPMAVAESIKGMYETLKGILNLCNGYTELDKETCSLYISKILAKAEGK